MFEYWADRFQWDYIPQIDAFADCLSGRVLPTFAHINEEGKQIANETYRSLLSGYDDEPDFGSLAELAEDHAITYYETMSGLVQGIINMFAVGLWHLFEQQLAGFVRRAILEYPADLTKNPDFAYARTLLHSEWGIDITRFQSYPRVDELRLLANCGKHGDGPSCTELRALRPTLFRPFPFRNEADASFFGSAPVIAPLGGEHLYLTEDDFKGYAEAVRAFWTELSTEVRSIVTRRDSSAQ